MKEYPKGAIKSVDELLTYTRKELYEASRTHTYDRPRVFTFNGLISSHSGGFPFQGYGRVNEPDLGSLLDMNVIENGYNDWFMFYNYDDALTYLKKDV